MRLITASRLALGACLCLAVGADRSVAEDSPVRMATVAAVAGQPITAADLSAYWFARYPEEYERTLNALVDERLVRREAQQFHLSVPAATLAAAVDREVKARTEQLRKLYGDKVDLASQVRKAYGVDVRTWRTTILRPRMHSQLLLERVVRWDTRRRPRIHARVIVRSDVASARTIADRVRRGADFGLTAVRESEDATAKAGGDLPWIARGDLAFPEVERALFAASPGSIVGPLAVQVDGATQWHTYKYIRRLAAWPRDARQSAARLEQDLRDRPFTRGEYERWRARAVSTHRVQTFRPDGK